MANQVHSLQWIKRSKKHEEKLQKLHQLPAGKIRDIGTYKVCFDEEFIVGEGSDGTLVYAGLSDDGIEVAVKRMLTHACGDLAENEKKILTMIQMEQSKHIVRYRYCKPEKTFTFLVLELCEETLTDYVKAHSQEELEHGAPIIIKEILTGLLDLHGNKAQEKILHRNLKPSNILVDVLGQMRLADFGISKKVSAGNSTVYTDDKGSNSEYWRAVESIPNENQPVGPVIYKRKSDIQVVGMLCYYILTKGQHPFGPEYDRVKNLLENNPVGLKSLLNPSAKHLVTWMLEHKIKDRPYVPEVLKHPYLQSQEQQFSFLVSLGNEPEIKSRNVNCKVYQQLKNTPFPSLAAPGWKKHLDPDILSHMSRLRNYDGDMVELLRFLRNLSEHWRDEGTPEKLQKMIGKPAEYFLKRFPMLPLICFNILRVESEWKERSSLTTYF